jgi:hypothetical protein
MKPLFARDGCNALQLSLLALQVAQCPFDDFDERGHRVRLGKPGEGICRLRPRAGVGSVMGRRKYATDAVPGERLRCGIDSAAFSARVPPAHVPFPQPPEIAHFPAPKRLGLNKVPTLVTMLAGCALGTLGRELGRPGRIMGQPTRANTRNQTAERRTGREALPTIRSLRDPD